MQISLSRRLRKLNNRGVSLVELIVAMAILSIVAVIVYRGILLAAKTNAKANYQHKATTLSQNTMEGLKATDLEDILQQFTYPTYPNGAGTNVNNFKILPSYMLEASTSVVGSWGLTDNTGKAILDADGHISPIVPSISLTGESNGYTKTSDGKYYMYVQNAVLQGIDYDIFVTLDGSAYSQTVTDETKVTASTYNSVVSAQIPKMDATFDGVATDSLEYDTTVLEGMRTTYSDPTLELINRIINVSISSTTYADGKTYSTVSVTYTYNAGPNPASPAHTETTDPVFIFDNKDDPENDLRNVFIFFRPTYGTGTDEIIINNPRDREVGVYLIKLDTASLVYDELDTYRMSVDLWESDAGNDAKATILTNLPKLKINADNSVAQPTNVKYKKGGFETSDKVSKLKVTDITGESSTDRIMDVTVDVFRAGGFSVKDQIEAGKTLAEVEQMYKDAGKNCLATMKSTIRN